MDDQQPTDNPPCPRQTWWRKAICAVLDHRLCFYNVRDDGVCDSHCTRCGWRPIAMVLIFRPPRRPRVRPKRHWLDVLLRDWLGF